MQNFRLVPLRTREFRKIRYFFKAKNVPLPLFSTLFVRFGLNSINEMSTDTYWVIVTYMNLDEIKATLYLGPSVDSNPGLSAFTVRFQWYAV
jgi:hypothetical protein